MEGKKGRMSRVYDAPGKKASEAKIKGGGNVAARQDPHGGKMPARGERTSKHKGKMGY